MEYNGINANMGFFKPIARRSQLLSKGETHMQTYLKNGYIVTMGKDETVYDGGGVLVEGDSIIAVEKGEIIDPVLEVLE